METHFYQKHEKQIQITSGKKKELEYYILKTIKQVATLN